jgi:hypothetical protein
MERGARAAAAVAVIYLLAFYVADVDPASWFVAAVVVAGTLAATAGIRALPAMLRVVLGTGATALFAVLGVLGAPVSVGLLFGAVLAGGATMSLFEARQDRRSGDIPAR